MGYQEDRAHRQTDEILDEMIRHLDGVYSEAHTELAEKWEAYLLRKDGLLKKLWETYRDASTRDDKIAARAAYEKAARNAVLRDDRFRRLAENLAERYSHVNEIAVSYLNDRMPEVYTLNYNASGSDISADVSRIASEPVMGGYTFDLISEGVVRNMADSDASLLPYREIDPAVDIPWNIQKINGEVSKGILLGESVPDIAKRLRNVTDMNRHSAVRNARTMVTAAENKGRMDEYKAAESAGVILERVWNAAHDSRVRDLHRALDGQTRAAGEPFYVEGYEIMYPGDPSAHPKMVYNCRCTLTARVVGFRKLSESGLQSSSGGGIINHTSSPVLPREKFTEYLLNPSKDAGKAKGFEQVLGYNLENADTMIDDISAQYNPDLFEFVGYNGFGNQYQQIIKLKGPNGRTADILTAWIVKDGEAIPRLVTAHLHDKKGGSKND